MRDKTLRTVCARGLLFALVVVGGCGGSGEVAKLDVRGIEVPTAVSDAGETPERLLVLVRPFEDERPDKSQLGVREHLGGDVTVFDVENGSAGHVLAAIVVDHLKQRGWMVELGSPETPSKGRDVVITGRVLEFSADADSWLMHTTMETSLRAILKVENTVDGSLTRVSLDGTRQDWVFWFDEEDLQRLVDRMVLESVQDVMLSLEADHGRLRQG